MKEGDVIFNILKNKTFIVKKIDIEKNLVITTNMCFLFYDQCQVIKRYDRKGQDKQGGIRSIKKE